MTNVPVVTAAAFAIAATLWIHSRINPVASFQAARPCSSKCLTNSPLFGRPTIRRTSDVRFVLHATSNGKKTDKDRSSSSSKISKDAEMSSSSSVEEYRNAATQFLSNFMAKPATESNDNVDTTPTIDYDAPKRTNLPLPLLAQALDAELFESEWFVTGRVNPVYFADSFAFSDPDVKITGGIRGYADGVRRLFDPATARAEVLSTQVNTNVTNTITCIWRLSGKVNIGPSGLTIKPYIVETDFTIDPQTGLIVAQEDKFNLPQWDILLSALFPVLIGRVTAPPAPVPARRVPPPRMPSNLQWKQQKQQPGGASPFAAVQGILAGLTARKQ